MHHHRMPVFSAAVGAFFTFSACSDQASPPADHMAVSQGLTDEAMGGGINDFGPAPVMSLTLTRYDSTTGTITGVTGNGREVSAPILATTIVRRAVLPLWPPSPIKDLAVQWNQQIDSQGRGQAVFGQPTLTEGGFVSLMASFADAGGEFRVHLMPNGSVRALRPLP